MLFIDGGQLFVRGLPGVSQSEHDAFELRAVQSAYEQQLQRQLVESLLGWSEDALDPRERTRCAVAAEVCNQFHRLANSCSLCRKPSPWRETFFVKMPCQPPDRGLPGKLWRHSKAPLARV